MFLDRVEHIYIAMPLYNLIEYSDYYSGTSGSLWQFKRNDLRLLIPANNADLSIDNSQSFKYKATLLGKTANHNEVKISVKNRKIVFILNYLSNF